jgi:hypothetical protein
VFRSDSVLILPSFAGLSNGALTLLRSRIQFSQSILRCAFWLSLCLVTPSRSGQQLRVFLLTATPLVSSSLNLRAVILVFQPFVLSKSGSEPMIFVRIRRSFCASCHVSPNLSFSLWLGLPARSQSSLACGQPLNPRASTMLFSQVCFPREIWSVPS